MFPLCACLCDALYTIHVRCALMLLCMNCKTAKLEQQMHDIADKITPLQHTLHLVVMEV
jgi:hypothetical protein